MKRMMLSLLLLAAAAHAQVSVQGAAEVAGGAFVSAPVGALTISLVGSPIATDTTIVQSFESSIFTTSTLECTPTAGGTTEQANDNNVRTGLLHQQIVAGLQPSTAYTCQAAVTNGTTVTTTFTATTAAAPASTAITGLVLGTTNFYNSINPSNQGSADTFYNCKANDGNTYMVNDDSSGFTLSGAPVYDGIGGAQNILKVTSESPLVIQTIQPFDLYGHATSLGDGLSSKAFGIFCMEGKKFLDIGRQNQGPTQPTGGLAQSFGNIIWSSDGVNFNNPQNLGSFTNYPLTPLTSSMWPGSPATMGSAAFVKYGADDGTLGYTVSLNEHDNGNAYVYLVFNEGVWNGGGSQGGGNVLYIARCARAKLQNLSGSDWQFYKGGGLDGNLDSSWSSNESDLGAMLSNTGELGTPDVVYVPAKNRYLMLTFFYSAGVTNGGSNLDSTWLGYEAPHPWGPWTLVFTQRFNGGGCAGGWYNPIILSDTIFSGTTPTVLWTENYASTPCYVLAYATLTIN